MRRDYNEPEDFPRNTVLFNPGGVEPGGGMPFHIPQNNNVYALINDIHTYALPTQNYAEGKGVARILSDHPDAETMIARGIAGRDSTPNISEAFDHFLEECIDDIANYGRSVYEISYGKRPTGNEPIRFMLRPFDSRTLEEKDGHYVQIVPSIIARELNVPERIHLSSECIAIFGLSPELEGLLKNTVAALQPIDESHGQIYHAAMRMMMGEGIAGYDFREHAITEDLAIAEATRDIGWNAQGSLNGKLTDYYLVYRMLKFKAFAITLRDEVCAQLNQYLRLIGDQFGFKAALELVGVSGIALIAAFRIEIGPGYGPGRGAERREGTAKTRGTP